MKYALKKVRRIIINDLATKQHKVTLNDLKNFKITGSQDTVYAEGQDGAKLAAFDVNKVASISAENGAIDEGYLALQVGSDIVKVSNGSSILIREEFVFKDGDTSITLSYKATGDTGNEVRYIYKADRNGSPSEMYVQNSTASATEFTYAPETKAITLPTVIVDAWFTDLCTESDVPLQLYLPKGKISGSIDLSAGDQAAVQNIEIESMTRACAGDTKTLWILRKYDLSKAEA